MLIQVNFSHPLQISPNIFQDVMVVNISGASLLSEDGRRMLVDHLVLSKEIRPQLDGSAATKSFLEAIVVTVSLTLWVLLANLLMQWADSFSRSMHYKIMIRALQYVLHVPLFRVALPAICVRFYEVSLLIATFDYVEQFFDWDE